MATVATATALTGGNGAGSTVATTDFTQPPTAFVHPRQQPNRLVVAATRPMVSDRPGDRAFFSAQQISGAWDHFLLEQQSSSDGTVRESPRTFYTFPQFADHLTGSGSGGQLLVFYTLWRIRGWDVENTLVIDTGWQGPI